MFITDFSKTAVGTVGHTRRDITLTWYEKDAVVDPNLTLPEFDIVKTQESSCDATFHSGMIILVIIYATQN